MAASPKTKVSVVELEQQISKLSAALDKARALEFAAAQKAVVAGQKVLASAKKKIADINAKGVVTAAAKARLTQAKKDQLEATKVLAVAQDVFAGLKTAQNAAKEVAKELAIATKGKTKKVKKVAVKAEAKPVATVAKGGAAKKTLGTDTKRAKNESVAKVQNVAKVQKQTKAAKPAPATEEVKVTSGKPAKTPPVKKVKVAAKKTVAKKALVDQVKAEVVPDSVALATATMSEADARHPVTNVEAVTIAADSVERSAADVVPLTVSQSLPFDDDNGSLN